MKPVVLALSFLVACSGIGAAIGAIASQTLDAARLERPARSVPLVQSRAPVGLTGRSPPCWALDHRPFAWHQPHGMRVLVTIPHFCRIGPDGQPGLYGSESGDTAARLDQVQRCLAALAQTFGPRQALISEGASPQANDALAVSMDVILVTAGDQHLAADLLPHLFLHCRTEAEPRCLGFVCHELMRERADRYDYFAYLEDDIEITDPLFFAKLAWFNGLFGHSALLQPNRFETAPNLQVMKMYVDGNTTQPEVPALHQDITVRPRLEAEAFGQPMLFQRVSNAHSGCFFVNAAQLARMAASPKFGTPNADFFGPLESAATLAIMRTFEVYKPARENAGFLEVHHVGRRFLVPNKQAGTQPN